MTTLLERLEEINLCIRPLPKAKKSYYEHQIDEYEAEAYIALRVCLPDIIALVRAAEYTTSLAIYKQETAWMHLLTMALQPFTGERE